MSFSKDPLRGVVNQYGARQLGGAAGVNKTAGGKAELVVTLDEVSAGSLLFVGDTVVPAGARIREAVLEVSEAFAGTFVLEIGEAGAEATNGITVASADVASVGTVDLSGSLAGEWAPASSLVAEQVVGIALASGTVTGYGVAKLVIQYDNI